MDSSTWWYLQNFNWIYRFVVRLLWKMVQTVRELCILYLKNSNNLYWPHLITIFIYVVDHNLTNLTKKIWLNLSKENLIFFNFCVIFPIVRCSLKGVLVLVLLGLATSLKRVSTSAKFLVIMFLCQFLHAWHSTSVREVASHLITTSLKYLCVNSKFHIGRWHGTIMSSFCYVTCLCGNATSSKCHLIVLFVEI